jgi:hypothetical protein
MKITKAIWEALPAGPLKDAFKASATNAEEYDNGEENVAGLKSAFEKEKTENAERGKKLSEFESTKAAEIEAARKKALDEARTSGEFKPIEDDYKRQLKELKDANDKAKTEGETRVKQDAIDKHAAELGKMFVSPSLAMPAIKSRLVAELDAEGKAIVRVLDKDGKASAASVEDLRKEFLTTPELKGSIVASQGSGGGATDTSGGGGSTPKTLADFKGNLTEESRFANANPEAYKAMTAAAEQS